MARSAAMNVNLSNMASGGGSAAGPDPVLTNQVGSRPFKIQKISRFQNFRIAEFSVRVQPSTARSRRAQHAPSYYLEVYLEYSQRTDHCRKSSRRRLKIQSAYPAAVAGPRGWSSALLDGPFPAVSTHVQNARAKIYKYMHKYQFTYPLIAQKHFFLYLKT